MPSESTTVEVVSFEGLRAALISETSQVTILLGQAVSCRDTLVVGGRKAVVITKPI